MITNDRTNKTGIDWKYSLQDHMKAIQLKKKRQAKEDRKNGIKREDIYQY